MTAHLLGRYPRCVGEWCASAAGRSTRCRRCRRSASWPRSAEWSAREPLSVAARSSASNVLANARLIPRGRRMRSRTPRSVPRLVLDDQPVDESVSVRLEVAFVSHIGKTGLCARVRDEPVRLERGHGHRELTLAPEDLRDETGCVAARAPARSRLEPHVARPELRPVRGVRDERESLLDRYVEPMGALDVLHDVPSHRSR